MEAEGGGEGEGGGRERGSWLTARPTPPIVHTHERFWLSLSSARAGPGSERCGPSCGVCEHGQHVLHELYPAVHAQGERAAWCVRGTREEA